MTPDELPADMEGRLDHALNKAGRLMHEMNFVGTPNWHLSFDDLRALLKAYQEQRRALEFYADPISYALTQFSEPRSAVHGDDGKRARAALNQKGDER
jgi:hypothetical protein